MQRTREGQQNVKYVKIIVAVYAGPTLPVGIFRCRTSTGKEKEHTKFHLKYCISPKHHRLLGCVGIVSSHIGSLRYSPIQHNFIYGDVNTYSKVQGNMVETGRNLDLMDLNIR